MSKQLAFVDDLTVGVLKDAVVEAIGAMTKYPAPDHLVLAFAEEAGELVKACMDVKQKGGSLAAVRREAVQAIAMALRLVLEGDPTIGLQPSAEVK